MTFPENTPKDNPEDNRGAEAQAASAQRQMPSMTQSKRHSFSQKVIICMGGIVLLCALVAVNGGFRSDTPQEADGNGKIHKITNHLGEAPQMPVLKPQTPPQETPAPLPPRPVYHALHQKKQGQTPEERKIASHILGYSSKDVSAPLKKSSANEAFADHFQPTLFEGARARLIPDRNLFITKGTFIECVLETAISSDVVGMTSCRIMRDVYSTSGNIVLLERGTRIIGDYKGSMQQGKSRLFVLWNRAETPHGVIIDLASGGTDALGRAGHAGFIDTHFYDRFSGAIMLSLIDDIGAYAVNQAASGGQNGQIQFSGTARSATDAAGIALENSINIQPTFYKNQGDVIRIFVARDLDFRGVYALQVRD